jgi:hypothetical protein
MNYNDLIRLVNQFIYLFFHCNEIFVFFLAHEENWDFGEKTKNGTTTTIINQIQPLPYSNPNGVAPNQYPIRPQSI